MSTQVEQELKARLVFTEGNYAHAVKCYYVAKNWVQSTGQCFHKGVTGVINHPFHPESPIGEKLVPIDLADKHGWACSVDIKCADAETLEWLLGLELPENARLEVASR